jgi:chromosomal replication initiation ATPase DnaA
MSLDLPRCSLSGRDDFIVAPSNKLAVSMVDTWPDWKAPWLALYGPAGAGKSHLASVWAQRSKARLAVLDDLSVDTVPDLISAGALVLDAEAFTINPVAEGALFHLINLVKEEGAYLLLTTRIAPALWNVTSDHLRSRLRAMPSGEIGEPDDELLSEVMAKLFKDRQITIDEHVIAYLVPRMERSLLAANRLVDRLDQLSLERQRPITKPLAAEVLSQIDVA